MAYGLHGPRSGSTRLVIQFSVPLGIPAICPQVPPLQWDVLATESLQFGILQCPALLQCPTAANPAMKQSRRLKVWLLLSMCASCIGHHCPPCNLQQRSYWPQSVGVAVFQLMYPETPPCLVRVAWFASLSATETTIPAAQHQRGSYAAAQICRVALAVSMTACMCTFYVSRAWRSTVTDHVGRIVPR